MVVVSSKSYKLWYEVFYFIRDVVYGMNNLLDSNFIQDFQTFKLTF